MYDVGDISSPNIFMKEWRKIQLGNKGLKALNKAEKAVKKPQLLKRIQCIKLKNKQWKHQEIADFFDIRIETVSEWIKAYSEGGIKKLLTWNYEGRKSILTKEQQNELKKRQEKKPFKDAKEVKVYLQKTFGITWHLHWVQKLLKKNFDIRLKNHV
jgi:transposase